MEHSFREEMEQWFGRIHSAGRAQDWARMNQILLDVSEQPEKWRLKIGCLRASFAVREKLSAWAPLRDACATWQQETGHSPRLLRGLEAEDQHS